MNPESRISLVPTAKTHDACDTSTSCSSETYQINERLQPPERDFYPCFGKSDHIPQNVVLDADIVQRIQRPSGLKQILKRVLYGFFWGGSCAICTICLITMFIAYNCDEWSGRYEWGRRLHNALAGHCSSSSQHFQNTLSYIELFNMGGGSQIQPSRFLNEKGTSEGKSSSKLVVAGRMFVDDEPCNIAQMNLDNNEWSLTKRVQLSLYNSFSSGEVFKLLANHTKVETSNGGEVQTSGEELILVGAFDTTTDGNSQVTYCSVGNWDGVVLSKVGEGLCNSALSKGMKITTASLAGPQEVFVAGSFQTQVWNGAFHEFVKIYNIAHFNAVDQVWLPLNDGQITCSWCTVTVLALAYDSKRHQLHIAGKFNAIDGVSTPAPGLAIYDIESGRLSAHPGGGLSMLNKTEDGVGTALQLDEESDVLYLMGSFERLTATGEKCHGLAAYEIGPNRWTCIADSLHTVLPTGGENMLLTPYGLMVAGMATNTSTWPDSDRPYTVALLTTTLMNGDDGDYDEVDGSDDDALFMEEYVPTREFNWSWLPGFNGHDEPLHALSNGFGDYEGSVFIAGDDLIAKWSYGIASSAQSVVEDRSLSITSPRSSSHSSTQPPKPEPILEMLSTGHVRGSIMAISQLQQPALEPVHSRNSKAFGLTIVVYGIAFGTVIGMFLAIMCNKNLTTTILSVFNRNDQLKGISLDTLTYSAAGNSSILEAYQRAMRTRYVQEPHLLTLIDPQEIFLQRIIGEGTFGRVWSAKWRSASVAVKEFVFAQAAVAGKSCQQQQIIEEIIGEAGMMAILRHPNVLQLFGCSLTVQAIWIVSELCSLGSLRQLLDDNDRKLSVHVRLNLALQVAEGMCYLHNQMPPIIHRDLKSHNIFVNETFIEVQQESPKSSSENFNDEKECDSSSQKNWKMGTKSTLVAKIGDWGSARATLAGSRTMTHGVGTACWLAPECIKLARSSKLSDVYGYGIVLWEMATREEVYHGLESTQIIAKVANERLRPPVPLGCPWKDLMVKCWEETPIDRPSFDEIVDILTDTALLLEEDDREG